MQNILDLTPQELQDWSNGCNWPAYKSKEISKWLYHKHIASFEEISSLSKEHRTQLAETFFIPNFPYKVHKGRYTTKYQITFEDDVTIEMVLIKDRDRHTLCLSSQAGCPLGCTFCATGKLGFARNLTTSEILFQVLLGLRLHQTIDSIVFMGMGEPLLNTTHVFNAIRRLTDPAAFAISHRRLTLSTVGIVAGLEELLKSGITLNLALSVHAIEPRLRSSLMPINDSQPLNKVIALLDRWQSETGWRVTLEYLLLSEINDSREEAKALANLARQHRFFINLIPYNAVPGLAFKRPSEWLCNKFLENVQALHKSTTIRQSKGSDNLSSCGLLGNLTREPS